MTSTLERAARKGDPILPSLPTVATDAAESTQQHSLQGSVVDVYPAPEYPAAQLMAGQRRYAAVVGRAGVVAASKKQEGDGASPAGTCPLREVFFRPDRLERPCTGLPVRETTPLMVWCDDPSHPAYNTLVEDGSFDGAERLWRDDHLYDLLIVLGWNDDPPVPDRGSAVFVHVARNEGVPAAAPTAGCIAVGRADLLELVTTLDRNAVIRVHAERCPA